MAYNISRVQSRFEDAWAQEHERVSTRHRGEVDSVADPFMRLPHCFDTRGQIHLLRLVNALLSAQQSLRKRTSRLVECGAGSPLLPSHNLPKSFFKTEIFLGYNSTRVVCQHRLHQSNPQSLLTLQVVSNHGLDERIHMQLVHSVSSGSTCSLNYVFVFT